MGFHKKNQDQNRIHNLEFTTNRKQKIPLYLKNLEWKQNSLSIIPDRENTMAVWKFDRMWRKKQCSEKKKNPEENQHGKPANPILYTSSQKGNPFGSWSRVAIYLKEYHGHGIEHHCKT